MKIVDPNVEIIQEPNPLKRIELCGRVCYKSEGKITDDSAKLFVEKLIKRGHTSVLEHARVLVPERDLSNLSPSRIPIDVVSRMAEYRGIISVNVRDYFVLFPDFRPESIEELIPSLGYMTVRFTCDRAIANELVRHRVFSFSQESTRYVNYRTRGLEVIRPIPFEWAKQSEDPSELSDGLADPRFQEWFFGCEQAESSYKRLIWEDCPPQEARLVLPLSTKTELIMTGTYSQWSEMLKLRLNRAAHPQMRYLMKLLVSRADFPSKKISVPKGVKE